MIKCCWNCRYYNRSKEMCENDIFKIDKDGFDGALWDAVCLLAEEGKIAEMCEEIDTGSNKWNRAAAYVEKFLRENLRFLHEPVAEVRITDDRNFCCNRWE